MLLRWFKCNASTRVRDQHPIGRADCGHVRRHGVVPQNAQSTGRKVMITEGSGATGFVGRSIPHSQLRTIASDQSDARGAHQRYPDDRHPDHGPRCSDQRQTRSPQRFLTPPSPRPARIDAAPAAAQDAPHTTPCRQAACGTGRHPVARGAPECQSTPRLPSSSRVCSVRSPQHTASSPPKPRPRPPTLPPAPSGCTAR